MHGTARVKSTKLTIFMIFCKTQHTKIKNEVKFVLFKKIVTLSSASTNSLREFKPQPVQRWGDQIFNMNKYQFPFFLFQKVG